MRQIAAKERGHVEEKRRRLIARMGVETRWTQWRELLRKEGSGKSGLTVRFASDRPYGDRFWFSH